ncbi:HK97 gp10 family phage protein [Azospirillum argentinense]|uniref:HK97 gp10 family phage protein n=1 Tax=Azospirillum argentinense TaxID=2970906 RepID=UPI0010C08573|nr:HK97 gp10 family phage protein [Azospirillum argentinense]
MDDLTKRLALAIYNGVVMKTPVATGMARANWQILVHGDQVAVREVGDHSAEDLAQLSSFKVVGQGKILIANGVSYIKALEYGHSQKAPEGMVRVTMAEVEMRLNEIMKEAIIAKQRV